MSQGKIKFKLLKDLPGVKAGRIFVDEGLIVAEEPSTRAERMYRFNYDIIKNMKDWFAEGVAETLLNDNVTV